MKCTGFDVAEDTLDLSTRCVNYPCISIVKKVLDCSLHGIELHVPILVEMAAEKPAESWELFEIVTGQQIFGHMTEAAFAMNAQREEHPSPP